MEAGDRSRGGEDGRSHNAKYISSPSLHGRERTVGADVEGGLGHSVSHVQNSGSISHADANFVTLIP